MDSVRSLTFRLLTLPTRECAKRRPQDEVVDHAASNVAGSLVALVVAVAGVEEAARNIHEAVLALDRALG